MSFHVCHCGWSKVTSDHGLRAHQEEMGCIHRCVRVEESDQLYMWVQVSNNRTYHEMDLYTDDKTGEFCTKIPDKVWQIG